MINDVPEQWLSTDRTVLDALRVREYA